MKILIISENRHNTAGGIEKYNNNLINIFSDHGHTVDEFSFHFRPEKPEIFEQNKKVQMVNETLPFQKISTIKRWQLISRFKKKILEIEKEYDVVINSTNNISWPKYIYRQKRWIYVQHFNKDFYLQKYIAGKFLAPIIYFGMSLFGIKNPFKKFQNIVFFTEDEKKDFIKNDNKNNTKKFFCIPIGVYKEAEIKQFSQKINYDNKTENFVYFGRIDNYQKRIKMVNKIFDKSQNNIDIFGSGNEKNIITSKYINYKGKFNHSNIPHMLSNYKFSILFSRFEGFPLTIVESLSNGIPVISTNCSKSVKWLINNRGIIVDNKNMIKNLPPYLAKMASMKVDNYKNLSKECFKFAIENLSFELFSKRWINLIEEIFSINQQRY